MSILPQHNRPRSLHHANTSHHRNLFPTRIYCSTTTTTKPKSVVSTTQTTITQSSSRALFNDPSLQSTWTHRAWLASGSTTVLFSLAKSITISATSHIWLEPILSALAGYILSDLASGIYHWGIDNYGSEKTPLFGSQIEAFQGHHKWPWTITKREFANNLHALARATTFGVLPVDLFCNDAIVLGFVGMFAGCVMFSQQFHAWAHGTKSKLPPLVVALQDCGVLVSRSQHSAHHRPPYNNNYCIVSGAWNEILDEFKVFEMLEMVLYFKVGVRPRSWTEPSSEWIEEIRDDSTVFSTTNTTIQ